MHCICEILNAATEAERKTAAAKLLNEDSVDMEFVSLVMSSAIKNEKQKKININDIMLMYHSGNDFLVKKAKEYIVINYEKYVHKIVNNAYPTYAQLYHEELYQSGIIGLIVAMNNYSVEKGAFTTYSKMFIRHEINDYINFLNNTTVHYKEIQKRITEAIEKVTDAGYEPTAENVAIMAELKPEVVRREMDCLERQKFVYLDDSSSDTEELTDFNSTPDKLVIENERTECLRECIESLPVNTKKVIMYKFEMGLNNEVIAHQMGITIGQVRGYIQKGLESLRKDIRMRESYSEYLSRAERELLHYEIPFLLSKYAVEKDIRSLYTIIEEVEEGFSCYQYVEN